MGKRDLPSDADRQTDGPIETDPAEGTLADRSVEPTRLRSPGLGARPHRGTHGARRWARRRATASSRTSTTSCGRPGPAPAAPWCCAASPGVGKSALIEATVARASDFFVVRLRGTALDERGALPKEWPQPVVELLNSAPVPARAAGRRGPVELSPEQLAVGVEAAARALTQALSTRPSRRS